MEKVFHLPTGQDMNVLHADDKDINTPNVLSKPLLINVEKKCLLTATLALFKYWIDSH